MSEVTANSVTEGQQQAFAKIDDLFTGLAEGRIVHYVMADGRVRPLLVLRVWDRNIGYLNGLLFFDGSNDASEGSGISNLPETRFPHGVPETQGIKHTHLCVAWVTSVSYSATPLPDTWHWPVASAAKGDATAMAQITELLNAHMRSVEDRLALAIQTVNKLLDSHSDMVHAVVARSDGPPATGANEAALESLGAGAAPQPDAKPSGAVGGASTRVAETSPEVATDTPSAETNGN